MDVSFFSSIAVLWGLLCLFVLVLARWCARAAGPMPASTPESPLPSHETSPVGESLSAARLALVLIGVTAPVGVLWLASEADPTGLHLIAGAALAGAVLITLAHAVRRRALDADLRGER
ncbi:MAG: hypothetical protein HOH74_12415 [Gemmatimonadetes bacterium]|nr:hypothetical protein [Gemmatimonadota bacterium]MBT6146231.1 hypothetical protein [Gemmatimonadota bacterium]